MFGSIFTIWKKSASDVSFVQLNPQRRALMFTVALVLLLVGPDWIVNWTLLAAPKEPVTWDELLNANPREIKSFLSGQLAPGRTQELQSELLAARIPL
jgi:hypothetical protein